MNNIVKTSSLEEIAVKILPVPIDSVLFGMGEDEMPVLFSVSKEDSPNTIVWDRIVGQGIRLIKTAIEFILRYKTGRHTEFVVMSNRTREWRKLNENGLGVWNSNECVAIVPFWDIVADQVLFALAGWTHKERPVKSPIILFIDGLENVDRMGEDSRQWLRYIMLCGRQKNIYVVGCARSESREKLTHWLECFQAEIFGQDKIQWLELKDVRFFTPNTSI